MGHTIGDGIIVAALAAAFVAYLYFRHLERQRRLEVLHQERMAAMDKGIPLPELPLDPLKVPKPPDPREPLMHGIVWLALGFGAMLALRLIPNAPRALAAAAAACVPRHRVDPVLRPCFRARALTPPRTPIGLTSGSSRGAASRRMMPHSRSS